MNTPSWKLVVRILVAVQLALFFALSARATGPTISSLSTTSGPVGIVVTITGSNFGSTQGTSTVTFNGTAATPCGTCWSPTSITVAVPSGASTGNILVNVAGVASNGVNFTVTALTTGWSHGDIGTVGIAGSASYANGTFTLQGGGQQIGGTSDGFHFVYQPLTGDGMIVARVVSMQGNYYPLAGVMIRETLTASSTYAYTEYSKTNVNSYFNYRTTTGGSAASTSSSNANFPEWVKLVRSGNTFSGFVAMDGVNWVQVGTTQTITMAQSVYVGLAVTDGTNAVLATATFDNVSVSSTASPAPVITSVSGTTGSIGSQVTIYGTGFGATQSGSQVTLNGTPLTINTWTNTSIVATIPTGATSGYLVVSVAPGMNDSNAVNFTVTSQPLLTPWVDQDIGTVGIVGSASYANGTFTVKGAGLGPNGSSDGFHFVYQTLSGDGTIIARVLSAQGTSYPAAGVMIRETLSPGSTFAYTFDYPAYARVYFDYRTTTGANFGGGSSSSSSVPSLPSWVELIRSGNMFSSFTSMDGVNWLQVGSAQTITMAQNVYVGLAVNNGTNSTLATATFDSVSISSTASPAPLITSLSATTGSIGSQVTIYGTGFRATQSGSLATINGTPLTINTWTNTSIVATIPTGGTSGPIMVSVAPTMMNSNVVTFTVTSQPLPASWLDRDVITSGLTGSATYANGVFTVKAAGGGIGGTADGMHFVYQPLTGDGTIIARVSSIQGGSYPLAGVMIRETLNASAADAFVYFSPNQAYMFYRPSTGATSTYQVTGLGASAYPYWVRLARSGNTFTAAVSLDGTYWTQIGTSQTIAMAQTVYIGLAACGCSTSSLATITYDNVSVNSTSSPAPVISGISATTGSIGSQIVISGLGFGAAQGGSFVNLNGAAVTINSWSSTSIVITIPSGATSGYLAVSVAPSMNSSNPVMFTITAQALPSTWLDQDIGQPGQVGLSGSATYANGVYTVKASGAGIAGTADAMHFVYQPLTGDGTIIARVSNIQGGYYPLAGVMVRETLNPGAANAFVSFTPNQAYLRYRASTGATSGSQATSFVAAAYPYWVKLARSGNSFTGAVSMDGTYWTQIGTSLTIPMAQTVYVGLAACSCSTGYLATATFDGVSIASDILVPPVITSVSATTGNIGSQVTIYGNNFGQSQGSSVVVLNGAPVTIGTWNSTSIGITIPTGATSGLLEVLVGPSMSSSNPIMFQITTQPLPVGWLNQNIGLVASAGTATYSTGTFTINGAGQGLVGTADAFHFVYLPLFGDSVIVARLATLPTAGSAEGLMIRETMDPGARFVSLLYSRSSAYFYMYERTAPGASLASQSGPYQPTLPYWMKLARTGNTFNSYVSSDGVNWTQVATGQTVSMAQNLYIGFVVSSGSTSTLATATFDNQTQSLGTMPTISAITPSSGGLGASVTVTGLNFGSSQGTSTINFNGTPATFVSSWTSTQIVASVPSSASSGPVTVVVNSIPSNTNFGFTVYKPVLTSITPPTAEAGASITLAGSGFGASQGTSQVMFNGVAATAVSNWADTSISALVPSNAMTGPVTVVEGGVTSNSVSFSVENLSVTSLAPNYGPAGTQVTISGTGFGNSQANSGIYFYGTAAAVQSWSDTSIVAIVPSGSISGYVYVTVGGMTSVGPLFTKILTTQLTDSKGNQSSYTSALIGGTWFPSSVQGTGCSSCTVRGNVSRTYDANGNELSRTDENGNTTTYTYDSNNNMTSISAPISSGVHATTSYTYDGLGNVLTTTDPLGYVTTNTYDAKGNLLSVTTPAPGNGPSGSVTRFAYNSLGQLTSITDPLNHVTTLTYTPAGLINTITDAQSNVTTYAYDSRGNRTSVTDALNHTTTFTFDPMNRLTKLTYPDTTFTQFGYDYRGRRTSVTDQNGKATTYAYDDANRLTSVTDAATPGNVTAYGYDTENNLTSIQDANSHTTTFTYDPFGRITRTTFPSGYIETYGYDAVGNLTSKTDRKNQYITYTYDQLNRLTQKSYPDSTTVNYTYDNDSRLTQVTDPTGTYQFTFDNMGRLTNTTASYAFLTGRNFTTSYTYDAASNRTGFTDPESGATSYGYDTLNRLQMLTPPAAFTATGNFGFTYDALSRRTQMTRPTGLKSVYAYDSLSRLLSVLHQSGSTTLDGAAYAVDNAGNRTSRTPQPSGTASNYTYDAIYQLMGVTQNSTTTESYTYDPVGNRLSSLGQSPYVNNTSNQLTSTPSTTYTYDNNGNMATKVDSTGTTQYFWDYENRMKSVTLPGSGGTVTFKYDPLGRRIYKSSSSGTSVFAYDGVNLIEETNSAGAVVARYSQGSNIDEPLAMLRSGTTSYYHADGLGSVTSLSTSAGAIANTYTYDSFGKLTASTGSLVNPFRFTGRDFDTETNLQFSRARYYDPQIGRFTREDPLKSAVRLNRYKYVNNSPADLTDPSGLQEQCTFNGTQQISPWIYSIKITPESGWQFLFSNAEGAEYPIALPTFVCNWERKVTKEVWKSALFLLSWNCEESGPCGLPPNKRIKYSLRKQREFVSRTQGVRDPTSTGPFWGGPQDDEANDLDCVLSHRPLE